MLVMSLSLLKPGTECNYGAKKIQIPGVQPLAINVSALQLICDAALCTWYFSVWGFFRA